jgi:hypothetical protein
MLPSKVRTFYFNYNGDLRQYEGTFTVLANLNIGQRHALALEKNRLLGNLQNPTDDLVGYSLILAELRTKIIDGPDWWKESQGGSLLEEEGVLVELFKSIQKAEQEWKEELKSKAQPQKSSQETEKKE